MELSVVIPAYNEAAGIADALRRTTLALRELGYTFEVVVIDDGSTDATRAIADEIAKELPEVRVLSNEKNMGAAKTALRGFALAQGDIITHNGADLPFDPKDTKVIVDAIRGGADVVVVERSNREAYGIVRKVVSIANITFLKVLFHTPFFDHNFVQGYRREVIANIHVETSAISTITPELIIKSLRAGYEVVSVPCEYHRRETGRSTIRFKNVVEGVTHLSALWWSMHRPSAFAGDGGRHTRRGRRR